VREFALCKWVRIGFSGLHFTLITTATVFLTPPLSHQLYFRLMYLKTYCTFTAAIIPFLLYGEHRSKIWLSVTCKPLNYLHHRSYTFLTLSLYLFIFYFHTFYLLPLPENLRSNWFNTYKFYMLITLRLCVLRTNSDFCFIEHSQLVSITEVESVYSAVRTESLYNIDTFRL